MPNLEILHIFKPTLQSTSLACLRFWMNGEVLNLNLLVVVLLLEHLAVPLEIYLMVHPAVYFSTDTSDGTISDTLDGTFSDTSDGTISDTLDGTISDTLDDPFELLQALVQVVLY